MIICDYKDEDEEEGNEDGADDNDNSLLLLLLLFSCPAAFPRFHIPWGKKKAPRLTQTSVTEAPNQHHGGKVESRSDLRVIQTDLAGANATHKFFGVPTHFDKVYHDNIS